MTDFSFHAQRRTRFAALLGPNAVAVIPTASERSRNRDSDFPYRHDSYFFYLTGFAEPGATLVLRTDAQSRPHATLFCQPKDLEREIWDGYRLGPEAAPAALGVEAALSSAQIDAELPGLLDGADSVAYPFATHAGFEGAPAFEPKMYTVSPSPGWHISGDTRGSPHLAPVVVISTSGAPANGPPTAPPLARNSSIT